MITTRFLRLGPYDLDHLSRKKCDKPGEVGYVSPPARRPRLKGCSSIGRASVSKTEGWGFETLRPCQILASYWPGRFWSAVSGAEAGAAHRWAAQATAAALLRQRPR